MYFLAWVSVDFSSKLNFFHLVAVLHTKHAVEKCSFLWMRASLHQGCRKALGAPLWSETMMGSGQHLSSLQPPLSCNMWCFSRRKKEGRSLSLETGAEDIEGWSSPWGRKEKRRRRRRLIPWFFSGLEEIRMLQTRLVCPVWRQILLSQLSSDKPKISYSKCFAFPAT